MNIVFFFLYCAVISVTLCHHVFTARRVPFSLPSLEIILCLVSCVCVCVCQYFCFSSTKRCTPNTTENDFRFYVYVVSCTIATTKPRRESRSFESQVTQPKLVEYYGAAHTYSCATIVGRSIAEVSRRCHSLFQHIFFHALFSRSLAHFFLDLVYQFVDASILLSRIRLSYSSRLSFRVSVVRSDTIVYVGETRKRSWVDKEAERYKRIERKDSTHAINYIERIQLIILENDEKKKKINVGIYI